MEIVYYYHPHAYALLAIETSDEIFLRYNSILAC